MSIFKFIVISLKFQNSRLYFFGFGNSRTEKLQLKFRFFPVLNFLKICLAFYNFEQYLMDILIYGWFGLEFSIIQTYFLLKFQKLPCQFKCDIRRLNIDFQLYFALKLSNLGLSTLKLQARNLKLQTLR